MDRLDRDLTFFTRELERERDSFRRTLLLCQICRVESQILASMRAERAELERQNRNMEEFLELVRERQTEKKW